jgi:LacI family transcriptional regulator
MGTQLRVALLVESSHSFGRRVLQGIAAYANAHGPWTFHHQERAFDDPVPSGLADWKADGVIARVANPRLAGQLRRLRVPVVDVYDENLLRGSFGVVVDHQAVVRLAVDHLRECGFQHLAYTGFPNTSFSRERARLFAEYVAIWGFTPHLYVPPARGQPAGLTRIEAASRRHADALTKWLCRLPKPVGLVACNDMRAQQVLSVCGEHGIAVPDTVGVIGIDNDEVRCDLAAPSLSSVDPNAYEIGYEAAALLDRMVQRQPRTPRKIVVKPAGLVPRRSTEVVAFANPEISDAVRYIREHACRGLKMEEILRHAKVSRATLDRQFLKYLGRTPRAEIMRVQVQRARELLATTDFPLKQVARLAGFSHVETMYRVLRRATNQTPAQYRQATSTRSSLLIFDRGG